MAAPVAHDQYDAELTESAGLGWIAFASTMMFVLGSFHMIVGLVGIFKEDYYQVGQSEVVISVDYTTWGWTHLLMGLLVSCAAFALLRGATWARVVTIVLAVISAVVNLVYMSAYPLWSMTMLVVDFIVIYGVTAYGGRRSLPDY